MMLNARLRHRPKGVAPGKGQTAHDRLINSYLDKIQKELEPEQAHMVVAINMGTGEYVLGNDSGEASRAFLKRWPNGGFHMCCVDGTPSGRM